MTLVGEQPPPPPSGPGVYPPFPAPPIEGRGRRVGLGLGLSAGVLLLVCGGGAVAAIGVTTLVGNALNEQAEVVVGNYLDAVQDREWSQAYDMLCRSAKDDETLTAFTTRVSAQPKITSYDVGSLDMVQLSAPVDVTYADGDTAELRAYMAQSRQTGGFEVCRVEE